MSSTSTPLQSGGAHTSRTMMLSELRALLGQTPLDATPQGYREAVIDENVLAKGSDSARQRSYRYLRELYGLDTGVPSFHVLRTLWLVDELAQPLLALSSALARDASLRATTPAVLNAPEGSRVTAAELATALVDAHPGSYGEAVANKVGRNAASTWTQSGHLRGRVNKVRVRATPRPASVAYALFLASLEGYEGELLFTSLLVEAQDAPSHTLRELARDASRLGWIDFRSVGGVTEVRFPLFAESAAT